MKFVDMNKDVFKMKECPRYAKYAFCCAYDGCLYFSSEHPEIMCVPGIEFGWIPQDYGRHKKCKDIFVRNDYVERLILCRNGNNFDTHEVEIARMKRMDMWREKNETAGS